MNWTRRLSWFDPSPLRAVRGCRHAFCRTCLLEGRVGRIQTDRAGLRALKEHQNESAPDSVESWDAGRTALPRACSIASLRFDLQNGPNRLLWKTGWRAVLFLHHDSDERPPLGSSGLIEIQSDSFRFFFRARFRAKASFTRFFSPGLR